MFLKEQRRAVVIYSNKGQHSERLCRATNLTFGSPVVLMVISRFVICVPFLLGDKLRASSFELK